MQLRATEERFLLTNFPERNGSLLEIVAVLHLTSGLVTMVRKWTEDHCKVWEPGVNANNIWCLSAAIGNMHVKRFETSTICGVNMCFGSPKCGDGANCNNQGVNGSKAMIG